MLIEVLILLGATIALLLAISWMMLHRNRKIIPPPYNHVEVEGVKLHYYEKGEGQPVVFLHGSNGSLQDFKLSILDDVAKDFRAIAFDRPGHGFSERLPGPQESVSVHGRLIIEAWKKLGVERPILVGHSSAGAVLMDIAVRRPEEVSAVVLISPVVHSDQLENVPIFPIYRLTTMKFIGTAVIWTLAIPLGGLVVGMLLKFMIAPDPVPKSYDLGVALALRPDSIRAEAEDLACLTPTLKAIEREYGKIVLPMVIVTGENDATVPSEGQGVLLSKEVPGSVLISLPNTGHLPMFTKGPEVVGAIERARQMAQGKGNRI